ncbi:MAG: hypothetical protein Q9216_002243 [Gyalolechia sp. 2 TL-2023]
MEDADDAAIDAILALQLQDLTSLSSNLDKDDRDQMDVDIDTAINLYRQELEQVAASVRDRQMGRSVSNINDDDTEVSASFPSSTPLYDQLQDEISGDTAPVHILSHPLLDALPITVSDEFDEFTHEYPSQAPTILQPDESDPVSSNEATGHQILDEYGEVAEKSSGHVSTEVEERTSSVKMFRDAVRPLRWPSGPLAVLRTMIHRILSFTDPEQSTDDVESGETCLACGDELSAKEQLRVPCGDFYCRQCMEHLFESAMKAESLFPPRCCGEHIPFNLVDHLFDTTFARRFHEREIELSTAHRTYCANPSCSTFIKAEDIKEGKGTCPVCSWETCVTCKGIAHEEECPEDPAVKSLMALAETEGYKQCHACKLMIELTFGCNHMICQCGAEFCYECGTPWKNCICEIFNDDRLLERAEHIVDRDGVADRQIREAQILEALRNVRHNHACRHDRLYWTEVREGNLNCEDCGERQRLFVYNLARYRRENEIILGVDQRATADPYYECLSSVEACLSDTVLVEAIA